MSKDIRSAKVITQGGAFVWTGVGSSSSLKYMAYFLPLRWPSGRYARSMDSTKRGLSPCCMANTPSSMRLLQEDSS